MQVMLPKAQSWEVGLLSQHSLGKTDLCSARANYSGFSKHILHFPPLLPVCIGNYTLPPRLAPVPLPSMTLPVTFLVCPVLLPCPASHFVCPWSDWCAFLMVGSECRALQFTSGSPEQRVHVAGLWPNITHLSGLLCQHSIVFDVWF